MLIASTYYLYIQPYLHTFLGVVSIIFAGGFSVLWNCICSFHAYLDSGHSDLLVLRYQRNDALSHYEANFACNLNLTHTESFDSRKKKPIQSLSYVLVLTASSSLLI